jgi:hypothetical protein
MTYILPDMYLVQYIHTHIQIHLKGQLEVFRKTACAACRAGALHPSDFLLERFRDFSVILIVN